MEHNVNADLRLVDLPEFQWHQNPGPSKLAVVQGSGQSVVWDIQTYLTDRFGDLNDKGENEARPALQVLKDDGRLLEALRREQSAFSEHGFVANKDGNFGILVEIEFACRESEDDESLPTCADVHRQIFPEVAALDREYPAVSFGFSDPGQTVFGSPTLCVFVPHRSMDAQALDALHRRLMAV